MARTESDNTASGRFPITRWSAVVAASSDDPEERNRALELLIAAYWKPVYKYVRIRWHKSSEDAKDLTQGFFAKALEKSFFRGYDPGRARFRTFLRTCLDGFVANEEKAARRIKRGGDAQILSLDFESAEGELKHIEMAARDSPEDYFEKEWVRSFFTLMVESLRAELEKAGKELHFTLFDRYYLCREKDEKLTYEELGAQLGIPTTSVTNYLALARREFKRIGLEKLREITATDDEFRREARSLLGVDA